MSTNDQAKFRGLKQLVILLSLAAACSCRNFPQLFDNFSRSGNLELTTRPISKVIQKGDSYSLICETKKPFLSCQWTVKLAHSKQIRKCVTTNIQTTNKKNKSCNDNSDLIWDLTNTRCGITIHNAKLSDIGRYGCTVIVVDGEIRTLKASANISVADPCTEKTCSSHGSCSVDAGDTTDGYLCTCSVGYTGNDCEDVYNCGNKGRSRSCEECPEKYGDASCSADCTFSTSGCTVLECPQMIEYVPLSTETLESELLLPDVSVSYKTKQYESISNKPIEQTLVFQRIGNGEKNLEIKDEFFIPINASNNEVIISGGNELYQLNEKYQVYISTTPNISDCNITKYMDTSFNFNICKKHGNHSSKTIQADKVCNLYNDCQDCDCSCKSCDCSVEDEGDEICKGNVWFVTKVLLLCLLIFVVLGIMTFEIAKWQCSSSDNEIIDHELINDFSKVSELCKKLKTVIEEENGTDRDNICNNYIEYVKNLYKNCEKTDLEKENLKRVLNLLYTLSRNKRFERPCFQLVHVLFMKEYQIHKNRAEAVKCLMSSEGGDSYLSKWVFDVIQKNRVFEEEREQKKGYFPELKKKLQTFGKLYALAVLKISLFYFDVVKDVATIFFFYHISSNILDLVGVTTRYDSVGAVNFQMLYIYLAGIVILSELLIYARVIRRAKDIPEIFGLEKSKFKIFVFILPVHFCHLEEVHLNFQIDEQDQQLKKITENHKKDNEFKLERISDNIKKFNGRLFKINQLHSEIEILESSFERLPQLTLMTGLFITATYYPRVLTLFDELFGIPITWVFAFNWISTVYAISNSIVRFRRSHRYPMSSGVMEYLQTFAVAIWVSGKIIFISLALSNMPYLQPIAYLLQILIVFVVHLGCTKCKPTNTFGNVVATLTTAAFFRPKHMISTTKSSLQNRNKSTQQCDNPRTTSDITNDSETPPPNSNTTGDEDTLSCPPDPHQIDTEAIVPATSTLHLPLMNYKASVDDKDEHHGMSLLPNSSSTLNDDDPLHPSLTTEKDVQSTMSPENTEHQTVSTSCSSTCMDLSFLGTKGGIVSFILFELFSVLTYTVLAIWVRDHRQPISIKSNSNGSVEHYLLPLFELFFGKLDIMFLVYTIVAFLCFLGLYFVVAYLYYKLGHPKKKIMSYSNKDEDFDEGTKQLVNEFCRRLGGDILEDGLEEGNQLR